MLSALHEALLPRNIVHSLAQSSEGRELHVDHGFLLEGLEISVEGLIVEGPRFARGAAVSCRRRITLDSASPSLERVATLKGALQHCR